MTGWGQKIGAGVAALALTMPGAQPGWAQSFDQGGGQDSSGQAPGAKVSATPQGGFVLKSFPAADPLAAAFPEFV